MGAGVAQAENSRPTPITWACLVGAALLPWFCLFSGTYGLYFYVVLAATLLAPWLLIPALVVAVPIALVLLLIMPAGAVYAAVRRTPLGWAGRLIRAGCVVSMGFAVAYGGLIDLTSTNRYSWAPGTRRARSWCQRIDHVPGLAQLNSRGHCCRHEASVPPPIRSRFH